MRIGIHAGPLVAGIIGSARYSFDVWGDTVNIAARAQQLSEVDAITVTQEVIDETGDLFEKVFIGNIPIKKRGGTMDLYLLEQLKKEHSLYGDGKLANVELRKRCHIASVDFEHMRNDIVNRLKSVLPEDVIYHDLAHTLNVEKSAIRLGKLEGLSEEELMLLRTAVLYHDSGFIFTYQRNELHGVRMMEQSLPKYGYDESQIAQIRAMILATSSGVQPVTLLEQIICDADHDYLGRADYYMVAQKLREEMAVFGQEMTEEEWLKFQLAYLEGEHRFHTATSRNIRERGKQNRIAELKVKLKELQTENGKLKMEES
jgi:hypothetical protein